MRNAWGRRREGRELLGVHRHVVHGKPIDEACHRDRPVQHERIVGEDERRHQDRGGRTAELIGDVTEDGGLAPDMTDQFRPA
jgi:hypothetical protein